LNAENTRWVLQLDWTIVCTPREPGRLPLVSRAGAFTPSRVDRCRRRRKMPEIDQKKISSTEGAQFAVP
jgi:hypothetical protein